MRSKTCTYLYIHIYTFVCTYINTYVFVYLYLYVCIFTQEVDEEGTLVYEIKNQSMWLDALDDARLDDVDQWHVRFHVLLQCVAVCCSVLLKCVLLRCAVAV